MDSRVFLLSSSQERHDLGISLLFFPVLRETHLRRFTAKTAPTPTAPHPLQLDMA
jgi:hypothetical protein